MANYQNLVAAIKAAIRTNGQQAISAAVHQSILLQVVEKLGAQYQFGGVVQPSDALPDGFGDYNAAFVGCTVGKYTNFGGFTLNSGEVALFLYNGAWKKQIISYYANTQVYGVRHYFNESSPDLTRIGSAELHRDLPVQSLMRRCVVDDLGVVKYYLKADDSTKKEDGTAADLTGADGMVMVEIPAHYRKCTLNSAQGYMDVEISLFPFTGAVAEPRQLVSAYEAVVDRSGETYKLASVVNTTAAFRGGNNTADWDDTYRDLRGLPSSNVSLTNFRTYARNRGTGWQCYNYPTHLSLYWLFVIEYATLNIQKAFSATLTEEGYHQGGLGPGVSNFSNWNTYNSCNPIIPCGFTNSLGNNTGVVTFSLNEAQAEAYGSEHSESVPSYRGVENPFGHLYKWTDNFLGVGNGTYQEIHVCRDRSKGADTVTSDYTDLGHEATANGYCKAIIASDASLSQAIRAYGDIFDRDDSGSSITYFCDYHYHDNEDGHVRGLHVGGGAANGALGGLAYLSANDGVGNANAYIGSRLCWSE